MLLLIFMELTIFWKVASAHFDWFCAFLPIFSIFLLHIDAIHPFFNWIYPSLHSQAQKLFLSPIFNAGKPNIAYCKVVGSVSFSLKNNTRQEPSPHCQYEYEDQKEKERQRTHSSRVGGGRTRSILLYILLS